MEQTPRYLIVDSRALPDVFLKVVDAKRMLESGRARSVNEAAKLAGISRSAFYKYKASVYPFDSHASGRIVTLQAMLRDEAGVLSQLTSLLYRRGANILTINQSIPMAGVAPVSVTARVESLELPLDVLLGQLRRLPGVESIGIVSGEDFPGAAAAQAP